MAATTSGWQWPVDVTAMPAVKSRKRLPSTSSMTAPLPRATTSGEMRVYDGETERASRASNACALVPGKGVWIWGTTSLSNSHMADPPVIVQEELATDEHR